MRNIYLKVTAIEIDLDKFEMRYYDSDTLVGRKKIPVVREGDTIRMNINTMILADDELIYP